MGFILNSPGPTTILNTTSSGFGNWYRVHPKLGTLTFQAVHTGASVGATQQSTIYIQGSNDGVTPLGTTLGTTLSNLATIVINGGSPQSDGFTINAGWPFVRAGLNSAPSTGTVVVTAAGQWRS